MTNISDEQFNFKWNENKNKTKGKSFKKRDGPIIKATQIKTINTNVKNNIENSFDKSPENKSTHIKRKHKKDKQLRLAESSNGTDSGADKSGTNRSDNNKNPNKNYSLFGEKPKEVYINTEVGKSIQEDLFATSGKSFRDLDIHRHLVSNLEKINYLKLTNVQEKSIPVITSGKNTLIRSQTGSGKTLAYAVPIINALQSITPRIKRIDGVQAIVVVPTRELAMQTHELFAKINTFQWIVTGHLCGGENRKSEKDRIRKGVNVLIGTPGRLLDHILHTTSMKLDKVRCLVLDEADRLLDMGFRKDIIALVEELDKYKTNTGYDPMGMLKKSIKFDDDDDVDEEVVEKEISNLGLPPLKDVHGKNRQTILLSATLTKEVQELAQFAMKDHVYIDALNEDITGNTFVIPKNVKQEFILTYVKHRLFTLSALIIAKSKQNNKLFVFMASTQMVDYHYELFANYLVKMPKNRGKLKVGNIVLLDGDSALSDEEDEEEVVLDTQFFKLHGNMDQKERKDVFNKFRTATKGVLICTDVVARGIDVPTADCIVQYTTPQTDEDYLHRVGRTGRAGKHGSALIFLTHDEQDYISHLKEHKVYLKEKKPEEFLNYLCDVMEESDQEKAALALQKHYENAIIKNKSLHKSACFAYSTWSRFYNSYPTKLRQIFDFKKINLGHYVTSFAIKDTPTQVAKIVRGQVSNIEQPRLNRKLTNHKVDDEVSLKRDKKNMNNNNNRKRKVKSVTLTTSEYGSGMEPMKKKKKSY